MSLDHFLAHLESENRIQLPPQLLSPSESQSQTPPRSRLPSYIPISPPVPHRRAPRPPSYHPRRPRARHIRMREPARVGLFTLCEVEEEHEGPRLGGHTALDNSTGVFGAYLEIPSAASSDIFPSPRITPCPSPRPLESEMDLPRSVDLADVDGDETRRLSWGSDSRPASITSRSETGAESETEAESEMLEEQEPSTPSIDEQDDPFALHLDIALNSLIDQTMMMAEESLIFSLEPLDTRPRRPPPLNLDFAKHSFAFNHIELDMDVGLPNPRLSPSEQRGRGGVPQQSLLPAAEILSPAEYHKLSHSPSSRTVSQSNSTSSNPKSTSSFKPQRDQLLRVFEDLLHSCGEAPVDTSSLASADFSNLFPLPPSHRPASRSLSTSTSSSTNSSSSSCSSDFSIRTPTSITRSITSTPVTPQRSYTHPFAAPPSPPRMSSKREGGIRPSFHGDHSFLFAMSKGEDPSSPVPAWSGTRSRTNMSSSPNFSGSASTSSSSNTGRRSLPRRAGIPSHWLGAI